MQTIDWEFLGWILGGLMTVLASVSAAFAAWANMRTADRQRIENQSETFFFFRDRYTSPEMHTALGDLIAWRKRHGDRFLEAWIDERNRQTELGERIDRARRHVSRYFIDVVRQHRSGFVSLKLARLVTANSGFNILVEICEPLNRHAASHYSKAYADGLRKIRTSYTSGELD